MNSADQLIYQAALLADAADPAGAISALEEAIALADVAKLPLQLLRARLMLGELLLHGAREDEAIEQFEGVLAAAEELRDDPGSVDEEVAVATEYLAHLLADEP